MNNKEQMMEAYEAPLVEVIEVQVERGFTISGWGNDSDDSEFGDPSPTYLNW